MSMQQITIDVDDDIYEILLWKSSVANSFAEFCEKILITEAKRHATQFLKSKELVELKEKAAFADLIKTAPQDDIDILLTKTDPTKLVELEPIMTKEA